jgi:8-oxo-dGTP pyrophosphatase MutT (NUDIX family)
MMDLFDLRRDEFKVVLEKALNLDFPYLGRDDEARLNQLDSKSVAASVLILFGYQKDTQSHPSLLYIRRTELVESHKGQMAFPGGIEEPWEKGTPELTALRETQEEVGIFPHHIEVIGRLPTLVTLTGYKIEPFIGQLQTSVEETQLILNPVEIADTVWIPLQVLLDAQTYRTESIPVGTSHYVSHVYQFRSYRIWGATAAMTKNLLDRLSEVAQPVDE